VLYKFKHEGPLGEFHFSKSPGGLSAKFVQRLSKDITILAGFALAKGWDRRGPFGNPFCKIDLPVRTFPRNPFEALRSESFVGNAVNTSSGPAIG
jgi:hypothetical protein